MIRVRHIYRAVYFYFYCISSTPDHQTSDPRAWGPLLQGTAIPSILHRKKRRQRSVHCYLRISIQWQPRDSNPQPGEAASCQAGTRPPTGGLLAGLGSGLQLRVMWPPQVGAQEEGRACPGSAGLSQRDAARQAGGQEQPSHGGCRARPTRVTLQGSVGFDHPSGSVQSRACPSYSVGKCGIWSSAGRLQSRTCPSYSVGKCGS